MKTGKILLCFRSAPVFTGSPLAQQAVLDVEEYSFSELCFHCVRSHPIPV